METQLELGPVMQNYRYSSIGNFGYALPAYHSAQGYGIFCGKNCISQKQAAGIPPRASKNQLDLLKINAAEKSDADFNKTLADRSGTLIPEGMSTETIIGIAAGGIVVIGVIIFAITR
jgi:hypothetical protein